MSSTLDDAIRRGKRLVSTRTGVIQGLYDLPLETNDPAFFHVAAPSADTSRYFGLPCFRHNGGAALTRERATMSAIGEAIERYCGGFYDPATLIRAKVNDMGDAAVPPWDFALFTDSQYASDGFPMRKPSENTAYAWVKGHSLVQDRDVFVPACFVYVPYSYASRDEFLMLPISTGLACGSSGVDATLRGLYEVVERDSFSITWLNRLAVPRLDVGRPKNPELAMVMKAFEDVGLRLHVSLATTDLGIPVVITLSLDDTGAGPSSVIAARADLDVEHAVMKSFEETAQTRLWAKQLMRDRPDLQQRLGPTPDFSDIERGEDHVRLYAEPWMREHLSFLIDTSLEVSMEDAIAGVKAVLDTPDRLGASPDLDAPAAPAESAVLGASAILGASTIPSASPAADSVQQRLDRCVAMVAAKGYDVIAVEVTTPDIADLGFSVVRVIVPGLHPLDMNHNYRYLGGERLYQAPVSMGLLKKRKTEEELNPIPHPFP